ncbi:hypothetical protein AGR9A_Lc40250 [Agrobacterium salinitolerans str. Hayward 0363]|nr:hypothetical protein AGR9A_Lc40250 [Agrobacterium salinitolerans str. Hayward 0363]
MVAGRGVYSSPEAISNRGMTDHENYRCRTFHPAPAADIGVHFGFHPQHHPLGRRRCKDHHQRWP